MELDPLDENLRLLRQLVVHTSGSASTRDPAAVAKPGGADFVRPGVDFATSGQASEGNRANVSIEGAAVGPGLLGRLLKRLGWS